MARSFSVVEQVKDRLSMVDLVGRAVHLHPNGKGHVGLCPFHAEKTPSFRVWDDHAHCWGCGWHGDVFTWVQDTRNVAFKEALRELADEAGVPLREDPEAEARRAKHASRTALLRAAAELYHAALPDDARAYLRGRGFTDEFVDAYLIGFAAGDVVGRLGPAEALLDAGLVVESDKGRRRDALWNRLVFPIWGRYGDEVVGLAGRAWPNVDAEPKYVAVPGGPAPLLNERGLRDPAGRTPDGRVVYLAEGDTDTATLVMRGLPVVGVRGAKGLKEDFVPLFEGVHRIYVCADADDRGRELVQRAGELLGNRCRVVQLPEGEDVNSYAGTGGHDVAALAQRAPAFLDWLIDRLPPSVPPDQVAAHVARFVPALLKAGRVEEEVYSKRLARALGVTVAPVREQVREARQAAQRNGHDGAASLGKLGIIWEDRSEINPSQFVHQGAMHTTVVVPARVEVDGAVKEVAQAHVVSGRREAFPLTPDEMRRRKLGFREAKVPSGDIVRDRWSRNATPFSLRHFLDGEVQVDPLEVYREIVGHYRRHIDYPNDLYYDFLALWVIGTYFFVLFHGYPYCHLHAPKRSGKSLTMDVTRELAFNAISSSSMSPAAMFRTIEACSPTVLIDEAEKLGRRGKESEETDDRMEILKAGYKPGFPAIRCAGDNHEPVTYDVYSPKMFGSIAGTEQVLGDRMITLRLARKRRGVVLVEFRAERANPALHATRDKLYCLMLEYGGEVAGLVADGLDVAIERVGTYTGWSDLRDRDRELWTPILTLALFFDGLAVNEGETDRERLLVTRMLRLAQESVEERRGREAMEQVEVAIVEGLLEYTRSHQREAALANWHPSGALVSWLKENVEGLGWLERTTRLYAELEKVRVILDRGKEVKKQRLGENGRIVACVRIDPARLADAADRLGARKPEDR